MADYEFILEVKLRTRTISAIEHFIKSLCEVAVSEPLIELSIVRRVVEG